MGQAVLWAAAGTGFTFFMTALGAAMVFFFRKAAGPAVQRVFLGFAAGVMVAALVGVLVSLPPTGSAPPCWCWR